MATSIPPVPTRIALGARRAPNDVPDLPATPGTPTKMARKVQLPFADSPSQLHGGTSNVNGAGASGGGSYKPMAPTTPLNPRPGVTDILPVRKDGRNEFIPVFPRLRPLRPLPNIRSTLEAFSESRTCMTQIGVSEHASGGLAVNGIAQALKGERFDAGVLITATLKVEVLRKSGSRSITTLKERNLPASHLTLPKSGGDFLVTSPEGSVTEVNLRATCDFGDLKLKVHDKRRIVR